MCKDLIATYNLKLLAILEAKIHPSSIADNWFSFTHIKWDSSQISFTPSFTSSQVIHGIVESGSLHPIYLSVVYAANDPDERKVLWEDLIGISDSINLPWMVMGDFNCCRFHSEKAGGNSLSTDRLGELNNFLFDAGLQDLASVGLIFTWFNQRVEAPIHIKLDRMLINSSFLDLFPSAYYKVDSPSGSDHSPLILFASQRNKSFQRIMFKDFWTTMNSFWEEVLSTFARPINSSPITFLYDCLRLLKKIFRGKNWSSSNFISHGILEAKAYWLSQGEDDLGFLYAKIRSTKNRNSINVLETPSGILTSHEDLKSALIGHFKELYNAPNPPFESSFNFPVGNMVPHYLVPSLLFPVSSEEIKKEVFGGVATLAPGPDGFSFGFFQKSWHITGFHLCRAVKHYFISGQMPRGAKATAICLIPKGTHSNTILD
ncbi:uncharacterized protein LOC110107336 [Dendrobium catenatum]|uniref:uncharacterized protein LOC110107336 n=1 Tax=Dendrobium catenatum TaxID=906689 RepID=UPI0009F40629|nr:uncharacterized protein LOC110107336 [Dendrobium catenatum]